MTKKTKIFFDCEFTGLHQKTTKRTDYMEGWNACAMDLTKKWGEISKAVAPKPEPTLLNNDEFKAKGFYCIKCSQLTGSLCAKEEGGYICLKCFDSKEFDRVVVPKPEPKNFFISEGGFTVPECTIKFEEAVKRDEPKSIWKDVSELPEGEIQFILKQMDRIFFVYRKGVVTPTGYHLVEFTDDFGSNEMITLQDEDQFCTMFDFFKDHEDLKAKVAKLEGKCQ